MVGRKEEDQTEIKVRDNGKRYEQRTAKRGIALQKIRI